MNVYLLLKHSFGEPGSLTPACTRPRTALLSCARLGRAEVECAAGDAGRSVFSL